MRSSNSAIAVKALRSRPPPGPDRIRDGPVKLVRPPSGDITSRINHSPPGSGEKYWSLSGFPSQSLESGGGAFLAVMFGQIFAGIGHSATAIVSSPESVSGLIASTGHSGSQTPQSMHSSGWMTSMFLTFVEAVHRAHVDAVHDLAADAALVDDVGQLSVPSAGRSGELIHDVRPRGARSFAEK